MKLGKALEDEKPERRPEGERLGKAKDKRPRKEKPREGKPKSERLIESSMERSLEEPEKRPKGERTRKVRGAT